jgi:hypothetical protein
MKALLCAVVLLLTPSIAAALPFTPDHFRIDVLNIAFESSGTNQFCWQCADGDPTNDLVGEFQPISGFEGELTGNIIGVTANFTGTATNFSGLLELLTIDVRVGLYDLRTPAEGAPGDWSPNPEYPLVSVSYGQWTGAAFSVEAGTGFLFSCCLSESPINGVSLSGESFPDVLHGLPAGEFQPLRVNVIEQPSYTPEITAVPEPTTLLLLGGGLIGAEWKRRRRRT